MGNDCLVSVDGVDCERTGRVLNSGRPDKRFFSHKFRGPALRYEVAVSIRTSDIVWIAGPCLPGIWNDITIFRDGLIDQLDNGERVEADDGYIAESPEYVKCPGSFSAPLDQQKLRGRVRMRHETVNEHLKNFSCLKKKFRHDNDKHGMCFRAVAVATQLAMELGEELFDVREYDDRLTDEQITALYGL